MLGGSFSEIAATANVAFLLAFPSLFSIINPIGGALHLQRLHARLRPHGSAR